MKTDGGDFCTSVDKEDFIIKTSCEGNCSYDGGYSFETVNYSVGLGLVEATELLDELKAFISQQPLNFK